MIYLPIEIINYILSFRENHPISNYMHYLINDCYKKDFNRYFAIYFIDYYANNFLFNQWYFYYRKNKVLRNGVIYYRYRLTPVKLSIGYDWKII